jgi:hypothetical protein
LKVEEAMCTEHAERVLLFLYVLAKGLPGWEAEDERTRQIKVASRVTGLSEEETIAAFAELEDAGYVEREP